MAPILAKVGQKANLLYDCDMKLLGIDYGEKRVGVAVSDETNAYAFPHSVIKNSPRLIEKVAAICVAENIGEIVVGESNDYAGKPNKIMEKTHERSRLQW